MNPSNTPWHRPRGWVAAAALAVALPAWAAGPAASKASIESSYQRDRAACQDLGSPDARTSCLRDAGASRAQALRAGSRSANTPEQLERNALQRCQVHTQPENRAICERMARGEGTVSGSVQGGGTIRELVTQEVLPAPPPPPPTPPLAPPSQEPAPLPPAAPLPMR